MAGSRIYVLAGDGASVYALDAATGARSWEAKLAPLGSEPAHGTRGAPLVERDRLIVSWASRFTNLEVLGLVLETGAVAWKAKFQAFPEDVVVAGGHVIVREPLGLRGTDAASGEVRSWEIRASSGHRIVAVAGAGNLLLVGVEDADSGWLSIHALPLPG